MAISTAVSTASFSVVLAETFAAVGLSTVIPAGVVTVARLAKELSDGATPDTRKTALTTELNALAGTDASGGSIGAVVPIKPVTDVVRAISDSLTTLDLLLPKTAKIHAEFEMSATDSYDVAGTVGMTANVVTLNAGYGMLYSNTSRNKITLDVDFVSVQVAL